MKKQTNKKNVNLTTEDEAFDMGWTAEQKLADYVCETLNDEDPHVEIVFIGAFHGLVSRLLRFISKEELVEMLQEVPESEGEIEATDNEKDIKLN